MKAASNDAVITARNLTIGYRHGKEVRKILENLEFELSGGALICLLGPNGVGKSTLLRTLAGIQPALEGGISILGRDIRDFSLQEMALTISMVLTDRQVPGNMKVYELVALGRHPHTNWQGKLSLDDRRKIQEAIELTRIEYLLQEPLEQLSDGQRQKVMIARALAQDGKIMLLDEPTAHLDLNNKVEIFLLLRKLALTTGKVVLVATHENDLAMQTADQLWIATCGKPLLTGSPEDLVLSGLIGQFMGSSLYEFDRLTGRIKLIPEKKMPVKVVGAESDRFWTLHALERYGFYSADEPGIPEVKILERKWVVDQDNRQLVFLNIARLIEYFIGKSF